VSITLLPTRQLSINPTQSNGIFLENAAENIGSDIPIVETVNSTNNILQNFISLISLLSLLLILF
jgi:hypothetical protein